MGRGGDSGGWAQQPQLSLWEREREGLKEGVAWRKTFLHSNHAGGGRHRVGVVGCGELRGKEQTSGEAPVAS